MSDNYPTLLSMGIKNPQQITSYTIYSNREDVDVLRIRYARPKGSFLPVTRSYRLVRVPKTELVDSGTRETITRYEVSRILSEARKELDQIVKGKLSRQEIKQQIVQELDRIESEFRSEVAGLRHLLDKLDAS